MGGLSIFRELRLRLPQQSFIYVGDDAGFPYGDWDEQSLANRIVGIFERLLMQYQPQIAIVACNTASTLILPALREKFDIPFVGTVPAIKPAALRTASGLITLLGTPGTISRDYTKNLITQFASSVEVQLVGARDLAKIAEDYLLQRSWDETLLQAELAPCFVEKNGLRTDIVILGCTHYPFLANQMRKIAPWPVDWIDPAEAIASHAQRLLSNDSVDPDQSSAGENHVKQNQTPEHDLAITTSSQIQPAATRLLHSFGLKTCSMPELLEPV